jgi:organic radical activating enzyme
MKIKYNDINDNYDILISPGGWAKWNTLSPVELKQYTEKVDTLRIAAQLGNACTYKCSYCTPADYDGSYSWPTGEMYDKLITMIDEIDRIYKNPPYNKTHIIWELLGGEITTWKNIEKFVNHLSEKGHLLHLITNGVRSERWWNQYGGLFSHVTLSYHPEYADYQHITNVGNILVEKGVSVGGLVLMYPKTWDTCLEAISYMSKNVKFNVEIKKLHAIHVNGDFINWDYTEEQQNYLQTATVTKEKIEYNKSLYSTFRLKKITNDLYDLDKVNIQDIINSGKNNWNNWKCNIGIDTLYINPKGDVKRAAQCFNNEGFLFNWKNDSVNNYSFPTEPMTCVYNSCHCVHDIRARKERAS